MNRCTRCCYPETRPDADFVDGVCSGCRSFDERQNINWKDRHYELEMILREAKDKHAPYDCVVPVSGGKDSHYQVIKLVDMGMKVLAVNSATDYLSDIGRRNLDNLKRFCDVLEFTPNIEVRKKMVRIGLFQVGDMSLPEHMIIWAMPTRIAVQMGIPLVVWGENPQREYARPAGVDPAKKLDSTWINEFGGFCGLRVDDMVGMEGLTEADLEPFRFPSSEALDNANVKGIWLGDFIEWDGWKNAFIAEQYGFEVRNTPVEGSAAIYENLDNHATVLRDYLRFLKFGYGRATDIVSNHIRRGRLTRDEGLMIIAMRERFPWTSLGMPIEEVLAYFGITLKEFIVECDKWTNTEIFKKTTEEIIRHGESMIIKHQDGTPVMKND